MQEARYYADKAEDEMRKSYGEGYGTVEPTPELRNRHIARAKVFAQLAQAAVDEGRK